MVSPERETTARTVPTRPPNCVMLRRPASTNEALEKVERYPPERRRRADRSRSEKLRRRQCRHVHRARNHRYVDDDQQRRRRGRVTFTMPLAQDRNALSGP
jgi:hypothetical protein